MNSPSEAPATGGAGAKEGGGGIGAGGSTGTRRCALVSMEGCEACWTLSASASTSAPEDSIDCAFESHSWASRTSFSASAASAESRNSGTDRGALDESIQVYE